jgi:signal transduction histidine kinase/CheY-like chemotaxis protein
MSSVLSLSTDEISNLFPGYVRLSSLGVIEAVGPVLTRRTKDTLVGRAFMDCVEVMRPRGISTFEDLRICRGQLIIRCPSAAGIVLKGLVLEQVDHLFFCAGLSVDVSGQTSGSYRFEDFSMADSTLETFLAADLRRNLLIEAQDLATNLTEARNRAEAADKAKSRFLADISHEIRTPLNGVIGIADVMAHGELSSEQAGRLKLIRSSGRTLERLLNDLLDLAKLEDNRLQLAPVQVDLIAEIRDALGPVEALARVRGLDFIINLETTGQDHVIADPIRLRQVLSNLGFNAVKFTQKGSITVSMTRTGDDVAITIADTGPGLTDEAMARLFQRFEQGDKDVSIRYGGSGLGLTLSREFARLMGGDLNVSSVLGMGSRFTVTLPLPTASPAEAATIASSSQPPLRPTAGTGIRGLVVDDNPANLEILRVMFDAFGIGIDFADGGRAGVEAWRKNRYNLILMDLQMPEMNGLEAICKIRQLESDSDSNEEKTRILIVSADATEEAIAESLAAGADGHLAKPLRPESLFRAVWSLF